VQFFGDRLRQAREARGVSLETAAEATRIAERHLAALETSDIAALPAAPFAKGYIKTYAQFLGIDPEPLLEGYRSEQRRRGMDTPEAQSRMLEELSRLVEHQAPKAGAGVAFRAPGTSLALVLLAAAAFGFGGWLVARARAPHAELDAAPGPQAAASPAAAIAPEAATGEEPAPHVASSPLASAPARSPATKPAADTTSSELEVSRYGVGTGIRNHELVGGAEEFVEGTRVAFWTRVLGGRPGDVIRHVWFHEGEVIMRADLSVGSANWRTYSRRTLVDGVGRWVVEARGPQGELLARQEFLCVPGGG
jgi:cytoskeletal protein RodZ